jgi:hypothetical protein
VAAETRNKFKVISTASKKSIRIEIDKNKILNFSIKRQLKIEF